MPEVEDAADLRYRSSQQEACQRELPEQCFHAQTGWRSSLASFHCTPLFSSAECNRIISSAETGGSWSLRGEYEGTTTRDMDALSIVPISEWLMRCVSERAEPLFSDYFGMRVHLEHLRILKYVAGERASGLGLHSDGAELSFICALNDEYEGGGTYVRVLSRVVQLMRGKGLLFCGTLSMIRSQQPPHGLPRNEPPHTRAHQTQSPSLSLPVSLSAFSFQDPAPSITFYVCCPPTAGQWCHAGVSITRGTRYVPRGSTR